MTFLFAAGKGHRPNLSTEMEKPLFDAFVMMSEVPEIEISIDKSLFEMGVSSIEILKLKSAIERVLPSQNDVLITTIMTEPDIRRLAVALTTHQAPEIHDPAIILQTKGQNTPLWLVHLGVG